MRKKAKQAGGKRRGRPPLSSGNRQGDPGPEVFPESKAGEERNPQRAYNLRGTTARKRVRSEVQISLQEPSSDLTPREDEWGEEQADEEILLPADSQDQPLPDERGVNLRGNNHRGVPHSFREMLRRRRRLPLLPG